MSTFRFVYMVSGTGSVFGEVLRALDAGVLPVEIAGVIADRPCGAAEKSRERGIPTRVIAAAGFDRRGDFDDAVRDAVADYSPDGLALNYNHLVPSPVVDAHPHRILNLHYALLPLFPGFGAVKKSIESGMRIAGVTVHLVDDSVDGGPIVAQAVRSVPPTSTAETLGPSLFPLAAPLFIQAMRFLAEGRIAAAAHSAFVRGADYTSLPFVPSLEADVVPIATRLERSQRL